MLKKLRKRFIFITMTLISIVLLIIFIGIYAFMAHSEKTQTLIQMDNLTKFNSLSPPPMPFMFDKNMTPGNKGFFSKPIAQCSLIVHLTPNGELSDYWCPYSFTSGKAQIERLIATAKNCTATQGIIHINQIEVRYLKRTLPNHSSLYVFTDRTSEITTLNRLAVICLTFGTFSFSIFFILTLFLSKWAIMPIAVAWEKQKRFVADASHELKTPLTIISANTDVILASPTDTILNQSKWLNYIKLETNRLTHLVNDLLFLSKLDDENTLSCKEEFNLSEALTGVCLSFESILFEAHKSLNIHISPALSFYGDENRMKQLAIILMDNAMKNTPDNGKIDIKLTQVQNKLILSVTNTGKGIPPQEQSKIFERFYRVDSSRERKTGGYGLGLSIAKSIVDLHKGSILVTSPTDGPTTFTVTLPRLSPTASRRLYPFK